MGRGSNNFEEIDEKNCIVKKRKLHGLMEGSGERE
jgi:hypothetical protein